MYNDHYALAFNPFDKQQLPPFIGGRGDQRFLLFFIELHIQPFRQTIQDHKTEIMPAFAILTSGITKTSDEKHLTVR